MKFFPTLLLISMLIIIGNAEEIPQPNNGARIPLLKADTSAIKHKYLDIPYDTQSPAQKLDIYLPDSVEEKFPVIISIHGGAFMMGDKADGQLKSPLEGLKRNYAVVSINYRLSDEAIFPTQINDVTKAIMYIKQHASQYHLDSKNIALWGGSAGGNLAALAGTLCSEQSFFAKFDCKVQAVIDWFGPINFLTMDAQFLKSKKGTPSHSLSDSPESKYLGTTITHVPNIVAQANPETYITSQTPPFFIQHGDQDSLVPLEQSIEFSYKLKNVIGEKNVYFEILKDAGHGGPAFENTKNLEKVFDFLQLHLNHY